ncbi:hypothetical protein COCON_G00000740 [Conger conger]|uniref:Doublecortin domain-containing protein n=1 Tax=Conger conger TaxID=82655 RepID=A0A9Q1I832_CONCO|nr:hypothetical protein COCON_G00000740 [Conger conger]
MSYTEFCAVHYSNTGPRPAASRSERPQGRGIQRPNVSAKWRKAIHLPCIIHVFRNGDVLCSPLRLILPRSTLQDLEQILTMVSEKASLRTGAVRRLCTLEGGAVSTGEELESGQYYVAVGTEKFKKLPYVELLVPKAPAGHGHRNHFGDRRLPKRYENRKLVSVPRDRYSDSTLLDSPEGDPQRGGLLFFAKPAKVHKNRGAARYTQPLRGNAHPSVFKADVRKRRKEVQGAEEVAEDEDTAVELPVDQRVAETVEDEELEKLRPETPRDDPDLPPARQKTPAEPRSEDRSETNSTPSRYRETNGRTSSTLNGLQQQETDDRDSPAGSIAGRDSQDVKEETVDDAYDGESSQAEQAATPPKSGSGSATYRSYQDPQEAGNIRPGSRLSTNELAA